MAEVNDAQFTTLRRMSGGAQSAGTVIAQVFEIGPIGLGRSLRDVTTLSDTVHKHKLNIPDVPEIAVKLYFDSQDTTHLQLIQDGVGGYLMTWGIQLEQGNSPNESLTFTAYLVNPQIESFGVDQDLVLSFTLKPQSLISDLFT